MELQKAQNQQKPAILQLASDIFDIKKLCKALLETLGINLTPQTVADLKPGTRFRISTASLNKCRFAYDTSEFSTFIKQPSDPNPSHDADKLFVRSSKVINAAGTSLLQPYETIYWLYTDTPVAEIVDEPTSTAVPLYTLLPGTRFVFFDEKRRATGIAAGKLGTIFELTEVIRNNDARIRISDDDCRSDKSNKSELVSSLALVTPLVPRGTSYSLTVGSLRVGDRFSLSDDARNLLGWEDTKSADTLVVTNKIAGSSLYVANLSTGAVWRRPVPADLEVNPSTLISCPDREIQQLPFGSSFTLNRETRELLGNFGDDAVFTTGGTAGDDPATMWCVVENADVDFIRVNSNTLVESVLSYAIACEALEYAYPPVASIPIGGKFRLTARSMRQNGLDYTAERIVFSVVEHSTKHTTTCIPVRTFDGMETAYTILPAVTISSGSRVAERLSTVADIPIGSWFRLPAYELRRCHLISTGDTFIRCSSEYEESPSRCCAKEGGLNSEPSYWVYNDSVAFPAQPPTDTKEEPKTMTTSSTAEPAIAACDVPHDFKSGDTVTVDKLPGDATFSVADEQLRRSGIYHMGSSVFTKSSVDLHGRKPSQMCTIICDRGTYWYLYENTPVTIISLPKLPKPTTDTPPAPVPEAAVSTPLTVADISAGTAFSMSMDEIRRSGIPSDRATDSTVFVKTEANVPGTLCAVSELGNRSDVSWFVHADSVITVIKDAPKESVSPEAATHATPNTESSPVGGINKADDTIAQIDGRLDDAERALDSIEDTVEDVKNIVDELHDTSKYVSKEIDNLASSDQIQDLQKIVADVVSSVDDIVTSTSSIEEELAEVRQLVNELARPSTVRALQAELRDSMLGIQTEIAATRTMLFELEAVSRIKDKRPGALVRLLRRIFFLS